MHAHVSPHADVTLDEAALRSYCAEHLEDYKVPRRIFVHDQLPRTSNGKIDRQAISDSFNIR